MRLSTFSSVLALAIITLGCIAASAKADSLSVTGSCPGDVTVTISDCPPESSVAVLMSNGVGTQRIPEGHYCAGTRLGLSGAGLRVVINFYTDESGYASYTRRAPRTVCGNYLQAVAFSYDCATSNVERIPLR